MVISCRKGTVSIVPVVILFRNKGDTSSNVVRHANRCPLPAHLLTPPRKKLSEASRPFDLSEDEFAQCSFALMNGRAPPSSGASASFYRAPRSTLRKWSAFAGLRLIAVFLLKVSSDSEVTFPITNRRLFLAVLQPRRRSIRMPRHLCLPLSHGGEGGQPRLFRFLAMESPTHEGLTARAYARHTTAERLPADIIHHFGSIYFSLD